MSWSLMTVLLIKVRFYLMKEERGLSLRKEMICKLEKWEYLRCLQNVRLEI